MHGGASGTGGPPGERNGQYRHGERTKAAIAEQRRFGALLKMHCPGDDDALEKQVLAALGRANGPHPLAERLVSALLRIDMPLRLAELARVPEENRDGFLLAVFDAVIDAWEHDAGRKMAVSLNQNEVLSRATDVLRAARQALADAPRTP